MRMDIRRTDDVSIACVLTVPLRTTQDLSQICRLETIEAQDFLDRSRLRDQPAITGQWCWAAPTADRPYPVLKFVGSILGIIVKESDVLDLLAGLIYELHDRYLIDLRRETIELHVGLDKYYLTEKLREPA